MPQIAQVEAESVEQIEALFDRLWPLLRSLTGEGVRATHDILSEYVPLQRIEVPSGTRVFDWIVPKEWVVREAYVIAPDGRRILDVADNNLRLVNYSVPFRGTLSRAALDKHLHSRPDMPDAIPYVTSYYEPRWGFCLSENERAGAAGRRLRGRGRYRIEGRCADDLGSGIAGTREPTRS